MRYELLGENEAKPTLVHWRSKVLRVNVHSCRNCLFFNKQVQAQVFMRETKEKRRPQLTCDLPGRLSHRLVLSNVLSALAALLAPREKKLGIGIQKIWYEPQSNVFVYQIGFHVWPQRSCSFTEVEKKRCIWPSGNIQHNHILSGHHYLLNVWGVGGWGRGDIASSLLRSCCAEPLISHLFFRNGQKSKPFAPFLHIFCVAHLTYLKNICATHFLDSVTQYIHAQFFLFNPCPHLHFSFYFKLTPFLQGVTNLKNVASILLAQRSIDTEQRFSEQKSPPNRRGNIERLRICLRSFGEQNLAKWRATDWTRTEEKRAKSSPIAKARQPPKFCHSAKLQP